MAILSFKVGERKHIEIQLNAEMTSDEFKRLENSIKGMAKFANLNCKMKGGLVKRVIEQVRQQQAKQ